jgi:1-acyl-sn-glycerol-3-phosphate acyltransferase
MRSLFHSSANQVAAISMKLLFGCVASVHVVRRENANRDGAFLLATNHISHFDPFIISSVVRRKIDWMAMAEFFPYPVLGHFLRAVDAFPADRNRANRTTIRGAIERLKNRRIVGLFPEGGIRDGARSLLEGAPLRPGASTLAHIAGVPILPCVILGSDRLYSKKRWLPLRRTPIWIAFGKPIPHFSDLEKSTARACIERELAAAFKLCTLSYRKSFRSHRTIFRIHRENEWSNEIVHREIRRLVYAGKPRGSSWQLRASCGKRSRFAYVCVDKSASVAPPVACAQP